MSAESPIRLLVVDEAIASGGVERLWLALMPELAKLCEHAVWLLPSHRLEPFAQALPENSGIRFETFHWPLWNVSKLKSALIRRVARMIGRVNSVYARKLEERLANERLQSVIHRHRITHVLYPALFCQPFPQVSVPVFAAVMDVNYHPSIQAECMANLPVWAEKAYWLLAISEFTKHEMERICPQARGKTVAIPIASDAIVTGQPAAVPEETPCLYYPASFNPHKGHAVLLQALWQLHEAGVDFRLILTGGGTARLNSTTPLDIPELEAARQVLATAPDSFRQKIEVRGMVSTGEVDNCYTAASLVVLPSSYEGFGLPLAEAVARGKSVLCADIPAFREQVALYGFDRAVTFVPGTAAEAWAAAIQAAMCQPSQSPYSTQELRSHFVRRTWKDVAESYVWILTVDSKPPAEGGRK